MGRLASVRDYIVKKCIAEDLTLRIVLGEYSMVIPASELRNIDLQGGRDNFKSKFSDNTYKLVDFVWKPNTLF